MKNLFIKQIILPLIIIALFVLIYPNAVFADAQENNTGLTTTISSDADTQDESYWKTDEQGNKYYYVDGQPTIGFYTIDKHKYYFNGNGVMQTGIISADGKAYYFNKNTGIMRVSTGVFRYNGNRYYTKKGVLKTGWIAYKDKAYFFRKKGVNKYQAVKDAQIGHLTIPSKGYLGKAYYLGIKKLNKTKWTLKQAYKNSYRLKYANRWMRRKTAEQYAVYGFTNNYGNCYCMASTFYIQAKLLGYNIRQIEGKVNTVWPHSWTQIKQNGKWYVYDPNFRNETGRNGWKIYYGKSGTWKYMNYHVFQK